jgi:hypothetical protein
MCLLLVLVSLTESIIQATTRLLDPVQSFWTTSKKHHKRLSLFKITKVGLQGQPIIGGNESNTEAPHGCNRQSLFGTINGGHRHRGRLSAHQERHYITGVYFTQINIYG